MQKREDPVQSSLTGEDACSTLTPKNLQKLHATEIENYHCFHVRRS